MKLNKQAVKNILIVRNDRFGEFLLNIPAIRALKESFPNAKITAITDTYVAPLAECVREINEVIPWKKQENKFKLIRLLKKRHFDIAVIFNPTKEFHLITALSSIPVRIGYKRKWGFLLTHSLPDQKHLRGKHEVEYNLELTGLIGANTNNLALSLIVKNDIIEVLKESFGKKFVAIHPWTSDPVKQWAQSNFLQLAKKLSDIPGLRVIIIGGKEELKFTAIFDCLKDKIINLTGKTSLIELAGVLQKSKLLISGDSGPVHLACAVNTPVLAIFRNDLPGKTALRWGPWGKNNCVIEKNNLEAISVDEVFHKAKEILQ